MSGRTESGVAAEGAGKTVPEGGEPTGPPARRRVAVDVDFAVCMLDSDGVVRNWSKGAERVEGYTAGEIVGMPFSCFFTPEDRAVGVPAEALRVVRASGRWESEGWRVRKDGSRFRALAVMDAVYDAAGTVAGFVATTREITERKAAEDRLGESERRFGMLVAGIHDYAIFMLDPDGIVSNWNAGAERFKGYTAEEIVGKHFSCFYIPEERAAGMPAQALRTALREGTYEAEGWRVRKDGSRFFASIVIDPIRDEHGRLIGFAKVTRDITERLEAQRLLEAAREQLFQSRKMEAIGQLTGGVAHDFNNLLTVILGNAQLARTAADGARRERYLDAVEHAAHRGESLIRQLLVFSQRQLFHPEIFQPAERLRGMSALLVRSLRDNIALELDLGAPGDPPWPVQVDPGQFELAILNICLNARDAMTEGGRLRIAVRNAAGLEDRRTGLHGDFVVIALSDTGHGIEPDALPYVFDPFFTTKEVGEGSGLGLSHVLGFVRQSGGAVTADSPAGQGATITIYLPAARRSAAGPG